jgi:phosphate transport system permease protein
MLFERLEWGPFIGRIHGLVLNGVEHSAAEVNTSDLARLHDQARERWNRIRRIEHGDIGAVNRQIESRRLALRKVGLEAGSRASATTPRRPRRRPKSPLCSRNIKLLPMRRGA